MNGLAVSVGESAPSGATVVKRLKDLRVSSICKFAGRTPGPLTGDSFGS